jgi:hypothetical protein
METCWPNRFRMASSKKKPWYEPSKKRPNEPIISKSLDSDFDTVVVDLPGPAHLQATE